MRGSNWGSRERGGGKSDSIVSIISVEPKAEASVTITSLKVPRAIHHIQSNQCFKPSLFQALSLSLAQFCVQRGHVDSQSAEAFTGQSSGRKAQSGLQTLAHYQAASDRRDNFISCRHYTRIRSLAMQYVHVGAWYNAPPDTGYWPPLFQTAVKWVQANWPLCNHSNQVFMV